MKAALLEFGQDFLVMDKLTVDRDVPGLVQTGDHREGVAHAEAHAQDFGFDNAA